MCVCAIGLMPLTGCSGGNGDAKECQSSQDCSDDNECTLDSCDAGRCQNTPIEDGAICGDGACQSGQCEAITSVFPCNEQGILDAIMTGGGPHGFDCKGPQSIVPSAEIVIDNDVILDGGHDLTVDGNDAHPVFSIPPGATVELRRFTVTGGYAGYGGGVRNQGTAVLVNCAVSGNRAFLYGGGVSNGDTQHEGDMTIIGSTIADNSAEQLEGGGGGASGGIASWGTLVVKESTVSGNTAINAGGIGSIGSATLINSTVSGNVTEAGGSGIWNESQSTLVLMDSTVSGNIEKEPGTFGGAGIVNRGSATLVNATVAGNMAINGGSAIANFDFEMATVTTANSLVEGDCWGTITSDGYNIESPGNTCGFDQATDQADVSEVELNLGPLADNGGPTMTHKPGDGGFGTDSFAIDQIPEAECAIDTDQRGDPRPETGGTKCDVGSVEVQEGGP